jgi:predicted HAD superfamily hydrolase
MIATATFDVFDTLLTRKVSCPETIFLLVGMRASKEELIKQTADEFCVARKKAECEGRVVSLGSEVGLGSVYQIVAKQLGLSESVGEALAQLELTVEAEHIVRVPGALKIVNAARRRGGNVVFVSDMYLAVAFVRRQLVRAKLWRRGDRMFVSSEWRASKERGRIFDRMIRVQRVPCITATV